MLTLNRIEDTLEHLFLIMKKTPILSGFQGHSETTDLKMNTTWKPQLLMFPWKATPHWVFLSLTSFSVARAITELHRYQLDTTEDKPPSLRNDFAG